MAREVRDRYRPDEFHPGRLEEIMQRLKDKIRVEKVAGPGMHRSESPDEHTIVERMYSPLDGQIRFAEVYIDQCIQFLKLLNEQPLVGKGKSDHLEQLEAEELGAAFEDELKDLREGRITKEELMKKLDAEVTEYTMVLDYMVKKRDEMKQN